MNRTTAAIIAEYNPFHNGHAYQIEETRRITGADFILIIMSGDFVQRGAPAVFNKYIRTKMALLGGADAVIELPSLYAVSSAEFFAQGSVSLLNCLGAVDFLSFGSESGNLAALLSCAGMLVHETAEYQNTLSSLLKKGTSFPAARAAAAEQLLPKGTGQAEVYALLSSPNNILALEYCRALIATDSPITPVTVKRQGNDYHEQTISSITGIFSSASAIRRILESDDINAAAFETSVPDSIFHFLTDTGLIRRGALTCNDFSTLLHYKLLMERENGFEKYLDCNRELSGRIIGKLPAFDNFTGFCSLLKSKNITFTRAARVLTHILLGITVPESFKIPLAARQLPTPYARLLGFRQNSTELLSLLKKKSSIPLISKPADAKRLLQFPDKIPDHEALCLLKQDILNDEIYEAVFSQKYGKFLSNEFRQSPVIL